MATVTFIKYKRQTGGTLRSVAQYVSQAKKTVAQTGHPLASGLNCYAPSGGPGVHSHPDHTPQE